MQDRTWRRSVQTDEYFMQPDPNYVRKVRPVDSLGLWIKFYIDLLHYCCDASELHVQCPASIRHWMTFRCLILVLEVRSLKFVLYCRVCKLRISCVCRGYPTSVMAATIVLKCRTMTWTSEAVEWHLALDAMPSIRNAVQAQTCPYHVTRITHIYDRHSATVKIYTWPVSYMHWLT